MESDAHSIIDVMANVRDEGPDGVERTPAYRFPGQDAKPDFDEIKPRSARGREVKLHARMRFQPGEHCGRRVGRRVIQNDVQVLSSIAAMQRLHELQKLDRGVALVTRARHLARRDVEGCVQTGESIAAVIMCTVARAGPVASATAVVCDSGLGSAFSRRR